MRIFQSRICSLSFFCLLTALICLHSCSEDDTRRNPPNVLLDEPISWISSVSTEGGKLRIAKTTSNGLESEVTYLTNSSYNDYKPVISPNGKHIAFFRAYSEGDNFFLWNTAICVMNIDGSNLRELTDNKYMNTEPYWSRDGSNQIIWNRMIHANEGPYGTYVYRTSLDANPGEEVQLSTGQWNWSNSSLRDGRIFVQKNHAYHLMTPDHNDSYYDKIEYPDSYHYLHKATISNDESMIAYMKKIIPNGDDYYGSQIVYAKFDALTPAITNEVVFVPIDKTKFSWYMSISPENKYIIYAEDGEIMVYNVHTGQTSKASTKGGLEYRYPTFIGTSK